MKFFFCHCLLRTAKYKGHYIMLFNVKMSQLGLKIPITVRPCLKTFGRIFTPPHSIVFTNTVLKRIFQKVGPLGPPTTIRRALASKSSDLRLIQLKAKNMYCWKRIFTPVVKIAQLLFEILHKQSFEMTGNAIYWTRTSLTLSHCVKGTRSPNKLALYEACT